MHAQLIHMSECDNGLLLHKGVDEFIQNCTIHSVPWLLPSVLQEEEKANQTHHSLLAPPQSHMSTFNAQDKCREQAIPTQNTDSCMQAMVQVEDHTRAEETLRYMERLAQEADMVGGEAHGEYDHLENVWNDTMTVEEGAAEPQWNQPGTAAEEEVGHQQPTKLLLADAVEMRGSFAVAEQELMVLAASGSQDSNFDYTSCCNDLKGGCRAATLLIQTLCQKLNVQDPGQDVATGGSISHGWRLVHAAVLSVDIMAADLESRLELIGMDCCARVLVVQLITQAVATLPAIQGQLSTATAASVMVVPQHEDSNSAISSITMTDEGVEAEGTPAEPSCKSPAQVSATALHGKSYVHLLPNLALMRYRFEWSASC